MISVCCFKLLGFRVICNGAVDNQYNRQFCSLVCLDQKSELQGVLAGTWLKQRSPGWSTRLRKKSTCHMHSGDGTRDGWGFSCKTEGSLPSCPPVVGGAALWAWLLALWAPEWGSCFMGKLLHKELLGNQQWIQAGQASCLFVHSFRDNQAPTVC